MPPRRRSAAPSGPTRVEAIKHGDKRSNIPTADAAMDYGFVAEPKQLRYDRDPALDPQLVWRGKDDQDASDLLVDAPPIYIRRRSTRWC